MLHNIILLLFSLLLSLSAYSTTWLVGPAQGYTMPSQVSGLVGNGDTVNIMAGNYPSDVTNWTADNLVLRGIGGMAHLDANGNAWGGKAIWVIQGNNTTVEYIEFSECSVYDMNGAGIRQEGANLTVRHCYFHDNENGILAGDVANSNITIEYTEFAYNGFGDGFSHNLYINHIDTLFFRFNYSHHAHFGHELKTRASVNFVEYNRITNEATGDASYNVDFPNGGQCFLIGNIIHQGAQSINSSMVAYGFEGLSNPGPQELFAINNTLVNDYSVGAFFTFNNTQLSFKAYSNITVGYQQFIAGLTPVISDLLGNVHGATIASFTFNNPAQYDYRIAQSTFGTSAGFPAGYSQSGYPLVAWYEYIHPLDSAIRCQHATLDAGAHESCTVSLSTLENQLEDLVAFPNPANEQLTVSGLKASSFMQVHIIDVTGRRISAAVNSTQGHIVVYTSELPNGAYQLLISDQHEQATIPFLVSH